MNRQFSRRQSHQPMRSRRNDGIPRKVKVNMPWDRWKQLSEETRTLWDSFSDEEKAIILGQSSVNTVPELSRELRNARIHEIEDDTFHDAIQPFPEHTDSQITEANKAEKSPPPNTPHMIFGQSCPRKLIRNLVRYTWL
jgi:hypothetical protein